MFIKNIKILLIKHSLNYFFANLLRMLNIFKNILIEVIKISNIKKHLKSDLLCETLDFLFKHFILTDANITHPNCMYGGYPVCIYKNNVIY